ncbi:hypothetical protein LguiA_002936 [Lonicera macranthoides]
MPERRKRNKKNTLAALLINCLAALRLLIRNRLGLRLGLDAGLLDSMNRLQLYFGWRGCLGLQACFHSGFVELVKNQNLIGWRLSRTGWEGSPLSNPSRFAEQETDDYATKQCNASPKESCTKGSGLEWHKIAHIPH